MANCWMMPTVMSGVPFIIYFNLGMVAVIFGTLYLLAVTLCREWVKTDLRERICEPVSVRWRPLAWRTNAVTCSFRVVYTDFHGLTHRAICSVYWHRRSVFWIEDEII